MKTKIRTTSNILILFALVTGVSSCNLLPINNVVPELDQVLVGIYNTAQKFPGSGEDTDAIFVVNDEYCATTGLDTKYHLQWDGQSFQINYTDVCTVSYTTYTNTISISGELSKDYKKLITYNGTKTFRQDFTDTQYEITEQSLRLSNVPLDVDEISAFFSQTGDVSKYIQSAYWRHTINNGDGEHTSSTSNLDFSHAATELTVSFSKVFN